MAMCSRKEFKQNFLKTIIMRVDFQGVLESEMDMILSEIKKIAKNNEFNKYEEIDSKHIDIALIDDESKGSIGATNKISNQKIFSFINENAGIVLGVSNNFICLTINKTKYIPFENYCEIVSGVANIYKEKIDFFMVKRFGLRKINECLVYDLANVKKYFSPNVFNYFDINGVDMIRSNHTNTFSLEGYSVNLLSNITQGRLSNKTAFSIKLDIDVYTEDGLKIDLLLRDLGENKKVNDLIFDIYTSAITEEMKGILMSEDDADINVLVGVEKNE